jgi:poly(A) polymerase
LIPADPVLAEQVASRFRLSGAQKKRLAQAARREGEGAPEALAWRLGVEEARDALLLAGRSARVLANYRRRCSR